MAGKCDAEDESWVQKILVIKEVAADADNNEKAIRGL